MSEKEKMLSGQMYDPMDPQLCKERQAARTQFQHINTIPEIEKRSEIPYFTNSWDLQVKAFGSNLLFTVIMVAISPWAIMYL